MFPLSGSPQWVSPGESKMRNHDNARTLFAIYLHIIFGKSNVNNAYMYVLNLLLMDPFPGSPL